MRKNQIDQSIKYLSNKFKIQNNNSLFQHISRPIPFQNLDNNDLTHLLITLGNHRNRQLNGDVLKNLYFDYLKQYKMKNDHNTFIEMQFIILGMSQNLIYDKEIINRFLKQFDYNKVTALNALIVFHALYKLKFVDQQLIFFLLDKFNCLEIKDQVSLFYKISALYQLQFIDDSIVQKFREKFEKAIINLKQTIIFNHSFANQYCQLMYNLFPELLTQNNVDITPYQQIYQICYKIVTLQCNNAIEINYYPSENINFIQEQKVTLRRGESNFESNVKRGLNQLNIQYEYQKKINLWEVDFFLQDKKILNCNGLLHFLQDIDKNILGLSNNHLIQEKNLKIMGYQDIINLNCYEWDMAPFSKFLLRLQALLQK